MSHNGRRMTKPVLSNYNYFCCLISEIWSYVAFADPTFTFDRCFPCFRILTRKNLNLVAGINISPIYFSYHKRGI